MAKKNEKRSFVMYDSFLEAMKHLNDADFKECVMKIRDYALENIDEESQSPYVNIILAMAKPNLDSARRRYEVAVENGKKGAEFGKLGGAPKGNQNARKNQPQEQPLNQPLDVDVNENENKDDDVNVNVNADGIHTPTPPSSATTSRELKNSSSSPMINLESEIVNNSERLEGKTTQENPLHPNPLGNSPANTLSTTKATTTSTPQCQEPRKEAYSIGEYMHMCLEKNISVLVDVKKGKRPQDDSLFWRTIGLYKDLFNVADDKTAIRNVNSIVDEVIRATS